MTRPYRLRLTVPRDLISADGLTVHSPSGDYLLADGVAFLEQLGRRFNRWLAQSGYVFQFHVDSYISLRTLLDLQSDAQTFTYNETGGEARDLDGEGMSQFKEPMLINEGLALERAGDPGKLRLMQVVVGGGGYAGTSLSYFQNGATNVGHGAVGDVEFSPALTGNYDPWAIRQGGQTQLDSVHWGTAMSHEMLNSMGVNAYPSTNFYQTPGQGTGRPLPHGQLFEPLIAGFQISPLSNAIVGPIPEDPSVSPNALLASALQFRQQVAGAALYAGVIEQLRLFNAPWLKAL